MNDTTKAQANEGAPEAQAANPTGASDAAPASTQGAPSATDSPSSKR